MNCVVVGSLPGRSDAVPAWVSGAAVGRASVNNGYPDGYPFVACSR